MEDTTETESQETTPQPQATPQPQRAPEPRRKPEPTPGPQRKPEPAPAPAPRVAVPPRPKFAGIGAKHGQPPPASSTVRVSVRRSERKEPNGTGGTPKPFFFNGGKK